MGWGLSAVAARALVWVFPLYPLVPRFRLWGPLGIDDMIPVVTVGLAGVALVMDWWRDAAAGGVPRTAWRERLRGLGRAAGASPAVLRYLVLVAIVASITGALRADSLGEVLVAVVRTSGRLAVYAILLLAGTHLLAGRLRRQLLLWLVIVASLEGAFGIAAYTGKIQGPWQMGMVGYPPELMPPDGRARVQGTFGGEVPEGEPFLNRANFYSAYLAMGLAALGAFWIERRRSWLVAAAAALLVGGILVSHSRMSLAAAFVGFVLLAVLYRRWVAAAAAVGLVASILVASPPLRSRFLELSTDRLAQWQIATRVIAAHPVLGAGDGRYLDEANRLAAGVDVALVRTPHNSVLYAAASYGVGAGLAVLALYAALLVEAARRLRTRRSPLAATQLALVTTFLVHDITNNLFFIPEVALMFWAVYAATGERTPGHDDDLGPHRQL